MRNIRSLVLGLVLLSLANSAFAASSRSAFDELYDKERCLRKAKKEILQCANLKAGISTLVTATDCVDAFFLADIVPKRMLSDAEIEMLNSDALDYQALPYEEWRARTRLIEENDEDDITYQSHWPETNFIDFLDSYPLASEKEFINIIRALNAFLASPYEFKPDCRMAQVFDFHDECVAKLPYEEASDEDWAYYTEAAYAADESFVADYIFLAEAVLLFDRRLKESYADKICATAVTAAPEREYLPITRVNPEYPIRALTRGIEGYVVLEFDVTKTGTVRDPVVIDAKPPGIFNRSAINAALRYKYKPKVDNGEPIDVTGVKTRITFEIAD